MASASSNRQSRTGLATLGSVCCIGLLLFTIASVIVLALIPVYLSRRGYFQAQPIQGPIQQYTYTLPSNGTYRNGSLTKPELAYLVAHYQNVINNNPNTAGATIVSPGATVTTSTSKKRQVTSTQQFLTLTYQAVFRPGTSGHRRLISNENINEIISTPLDNYNFLLLSDSSNQESTTTITTTTTTTTAAIPVVTSYTPTGVTCPAGPFVVSANGLHPDEAAWLQRRAPIAESSLRSWLTGIGLSATDYSPNTALPRIALATSGGSYRSLLTGAGVIQAMDGREQSTRTALSGLLQGITYQTGTSGGAWLLTSFAINNYPTISFLRDSLWSQRLQYFLADPNPVQPDYQRVATAQIIDKKNAGFEVTAADSWSRDLAFQLIQSPNGGPNVTFDQITLTDAFKSFSLPFPIVTAVQYDPKTCAPGLNASMYEFTPYTFGSWDTGIHAFTPIKLLGTRYNNGQPPANGKCIIGYDNAGFVLGTSSFLFSLVRCALSPNASKLLPPNVLKQILGIIPAVNATIQGIVSANVSATGESFYSAVYPNPFQGSTQSPKVSSLSDLHLVDGGQTSQNIPLWPLIQPARKVDLIFANDNSADQMNLPNGAQLMTTYAQALLSGLPFPFIPAANTFVSQGLNVRPAFFGCNETGVPLVIYLPNTNISFPSAIPTFKPTYSTNDTLGLIQNGLNVATRNNSIPWARCVACAIARRVTGLYSTGTSAECRSCFNTYCF